MGPGTGSMGVHFRVGEGVGNRFVGLLRLTSLQRQGGGNGRLGV
jgi:hypothetical protein